MHSDDKMRNWLLGNCACNTNTLQQNINNTFRNYEQINNY